MLRLLCAFFFSIATVASAENLYVSSPGDGFLNLRAGPSTSHKILMEMKHGTKAKVLSRSGNWLRVKHQSGRTGWAYGKYLVSQRNVKPRQTETASGNHFGRTTATLKEALRVPGTSLRLCDSGLSIFAISRSLYSCASTDSETLTSKKFAIQINMGLVVMERIIAPKGKGKVHNAICGGRNRYTQRHSPCKFKFSDEVYVILENTRYGMSYHYVFGSFDRGDQLALTVSVAGVADPRKLLIDRIFKKNGFKLR